MGKSKVLDEALKFGKEQQESELVIDFDASIEEAKAKPIKVKYKGKVYEVPSVTPQWYTNLVNRKLARVKDLRLEDMEEEEIIERLAISDSENEEIYRRLFGDEFVDEFLSDNWVNMKNFNDDLLYPILEKWGWARPKDTTELTKKKAKTPDS